MLGTVNKRRLISREFSTLFRKSERQIGLHRPERITEQKQAKMHTILKPQLGNLRQIMD